MTITKNTLTAADQPQRLGLAIGLVLLANLLFSVVDTSTKWLLGAGLVVFQLAFMRYAVHFAITVVERVIRGKPARALPVRVRGLVVLRSFFLVSATLANFLALGHLPLSITAAMLYTSPLFVCLFAYLVLGESIRKAHVVSVPMGLLGALIVVWPFGAPINWYAVLMLYPAMAMAMYQVLSRKLAEEVTPGELQFYTGALGTLALAPFALVFWQPPSAPSEWALLVAIGAFAWAGHEALTRAHGFATASTLAPFGYSFVLYLTLAGLLVFDDVPALSTLVGAGLIVLSGVLIWQAEQHRAKEVTP